MSDLTQQMAVAKRFTVLDTLGTDGTDGQSLKGQNVNNYPNGALFFVRSANRLYRLKKNLDVAVVADTGIYSNVVDGVASSSAAGRFVAVEQFATLTLSTGGTAVLAGWDFTGGGVFQINYVMLGGTQGFLSADRTGTSSLFQVTATSSNSADRSVVLVTFLQLPGAANP